MAKRDYYTTLGLSRDATEEDIKKSYRKMAMKHHPDRNPDDKGSEEKFKEAKEAYEVLTDAKKRAAYDQFGHAGVDPSAGFGGRPGGPRGRGRVGAGVRGHVRGDFGGAGAGRGQRGLPPGGPSAPPQLVPAEGGAGAVATASTSAV